MHLQILITILICANFINADSEDRRWGPSLAFGYHKTSKKAPHVEHFTTNLHIGAPPHPRTNDLAIAPGVVTSNGYTLYYKISANKNAEIDGWDIQVCASINQKRTVICFGGDQYEIKNVTADTIITSDFAYNETSKRITQALHLNGRPNSTLEWQLNVGIPQQIRFDVLCGSHCSKTAQEVPGFQYSNTAVQLSKADHHFAHRAEAAYLDHLEGWDTMRSTDHGSTWKLDELTVKVFAWPAGGGNIIVNQSDGTHNEWTWLRRWTPKVVHLVKMFNTCMVARTTYKYFRWLPTEVQFHMCLSFFGTLTIELLRRWPQIVIMREMDAAYG